MAEAEDNEREPDLENWLSAYLSVRQSEHEELYAAPQTPEEETLHRAFDKIENVALDLVTTGQVPSRLEQDLADIWPGTPLPEKVTELLKYDIVQDRLQFAAAQEAVYRLKDLPAHVQVSVTAFRILRRARPSPTAAKYLQRATHLYLAGFVAEALVMCGAVLEAALANRLPDELLNAAGMKPRFRRTGVFSIGQRMDYEAKHPILTDEQRDHFWEIQNYRNDAVHVQPDIGPETPELAIWLTAYLLGVILPASDA